jgi:hypothetical protein
MSSRLNRTLTGGVLLPVLLFSLLVTSFATWRCRFDGVVRSSSCCPVKASADVETGGLAVSGTSSCCEMKRHMVQRIPSDLSRASHQEGLGSALALPVALLPAVEVADRFRIALAPDRPIAPGGRAIVLQKRSFLI